MITSRKPIENQSVYSNINKETKQIANDYEISDRIDCPGKDDAFISLKKHQDNFLSNLKCRLFNPAKSEIGKIRKLVIENINTKV